MGRNDPDVTWSDARLIRACLAGHEEAWTTLIAKYKNLIYSIPLKYGATPQDAADIFQAVCLELFSELPRLRKPDSLRSWLITVAAHQSFHWSRKVRRRAEDELTDLEAEKLGTDPTRDLIAQVEREQQLRDAVAALPARCQEMILCGCIQGVSIKVCTAYLLFLIRVHLLFGAS